LGNKPAKIVTKLPQAKKSLKFLPSHVQKRTVKAGKRNARQRSLSKAAKKKYKSAKRLKRAELLIKKRDEPKNFPFRKGQSPFRMTRRPLDTPIYRRSTKITYHMFGKTLSIYNGRYFTMYKVNDQSVLGLKVGELAFTKQWLGTSTHTRRKKKKV